MLLYVCVIHVHVYVCVHVRMCLCVCAYHGVHIQIIRHHSELSSLSTMWYPVIETGHQVYCRGLMCQCIVCFFVLILLGEKFTSCTQSHSLALRVGSFMPISSGPAPPCFPAWSTLLRAAVGKGLGCLFCSHILEASSSQLWQPGPAPTLLPW